MKTLIVASLLLGAAAGAALAGAEDPSIVTYLGGTVPGLKEGASGRLDQTTAEALKFGSGGMEISIPYQLMTRIEYREENRFRLGVVGTIVVGMVKAREKVHSITITWAKDKETPNVMSLEMTRAEATELLSILRARAQVTPTVCEAKFNQTCLRPR